MLWMLIVCLFVGLRVQVVNGGKTPLGRLLEPLVKNEPEEPHFFFRVCMSGVRRVDPHSLGLIFVGDTRLLMPTDFMYSVHSHLAPVVVSNLESNKKWNYRGVMVIIEQEFILNYIAGLQNNDFWSPKKFYIFVITRDCSELLLSFLERIWDTYRIGYTITVCSNDFNVIYTFDPNKFERQLSVFDSSNEDVLLTKVKRLNVMNLNLDPLKVAMFPTTKTATLKPDGTYGAADGVMLQLLAAKMNFTAITLIPEDGQRYGQLLSNGTLTGALGQIAYGKTDLFCNRIFIKSYGSNSIEYTVAFEFDQLCVIVPKAEKNRIWMFILLCFEPDAWILLLISYLLSVLTWYVVRSYLDQKDPDCILLSIELLQIFLNSSIKRRLVRASEKIFIIFVVIFSLIMAHTFQTFLVKSFSMQTYKKDIQTLEDLDKSSLKVYVASKNLGDTFLAEDNELMSRLFKKFIYNFEDSQKIRWKRIAYARDIAVLGKKRDLQDQVDDITENGNPLLHLVRECPRAYHIAFLVTVNSPYVDSINMIISRSLAGGLMKSWFFHNRTKDNVRVNREAWNENVRFSVKHLAIAFTALLIGLSVALIGFVIEIASVRLWM